ncbi:hypothetical protein [Butyrivibrio sp. INlla14]|nr:hypothetical protein [Butyrivibrio sp. INlla14]SCY62344.1 hypothetical protein SAMN02910371_03077 [Butyrivibrio sp. INlla14]
MNKLFNKALAVVLAGTMVIGASVTAFADDINPKVVKCVLKSSLLI